MHHSHSQNRAPSHPQQRIIAESSTSAANHQRVGQVRVQPTLGEPVRPTLGSLGTLIDRTPGHELPSKYDGYEPTAPYEQLSPEHRQLRDLHHLSDHCDRASTHATREMWARHRLQVAQGQGHGPSLIPDISVGSDGRYNHPGIAFNQPPFDFFAHSALILPQYENFNAAYFSEFPAVPEGIDDGLFGLEALGYDDWSLDLGEFGQIPLPDFQPEAVHQGVPTPPGLRQYVAAQGQSSITGNVQNSADESWRDSNPPEPSSSSSEAQFR